MWAILPVKSFADAKQRLADVLSESKRRRLSEAMFNDVLSAVTQTPEIQHVLVVTADKDIAAIATGYHAEVLLEPAHCVGLNAAIELAVHHVQMRGGDRALILHADIPLTNKDDLTYLIRGQFEGGISLIPDKHEQGTNGMVLNLPTTFVFQFGENSYQKHQQSAAEQGLMCSMAELPDLTLDIDQPEDLLELAMRCRRYPQLATSQLLLRPEMQQMLHRIGGDKV